VEYQREDWELWLLVVLPSLQNRGPTPSSRKTERKQITNKQEHSKIITNKTLFNIEGKWKFLMFKILMFRLKVRPKSGRSDQKISKSTLYTRENANFKASAI